MDFFLYQQNNDGAYYKAKESVATSEKNSAYIGLYVPKGKNEATALFWNWHPINNPNFYQIPLNQPLRGKKNTKTEYLNKQSSFTTAGATLTYAGVSNGQIRFIYNEFTMKGDLKPDYKQEVVLDYKPNATYSYKSAIFKVSKADSAQIKFEIIAPLE